SFVESLKLVVIIQKGSWLLLYENPLVLFPEFFLFGFRQWAGQSGDHAVEFGVLEGGGMI
ncbi:MAG: hypothetical protein HGB15_07195, partial [Chlorobaculum sp.]|nr:hypothetical protein [Chlorobaculum sp.]